MTSCVRSVKKKNLNSHFFSKMYRNYEYPEIIFVGISWTITKLVEYAGSLLRDLLKL